MKQARLMKKTDVVLLHHLRCDPFNNAVYWKGVLVDFVNVDNYPYQHDYLTALAHHCLHLESISVPVNMDTAVYHRHWFEPMKSDHPYKHLLMTCPSIYVSLHGIMIIGNTKVMEYDGEYWRFYPRFDEESDFDWSQRWDDYTRQRRGYRGISLSYSDLDGLTHCLNHFNIPLELLDQC